MLGESSTLSSKYDTTTNVVDGVSIQGRKSHIFALAPTYDANKHPYAMALRGVHILGSAARVEGEDCWNLNEELIESCQGNYWQSNDNAGTKNDCPYNVGVLIAGNGADIMNRPRGSDGVFIYGAVGCISDHNNYGVIIGGTTVPKRTNQDSVGTTKTTFVSGPGIFIRGTGTGDDGVIADENGYSLITPSKIQVSTRSNLPTDFEGFLNLTKHCTIKDANGKVIVKDGVFMGTI